MTHSFLRASVIQGFFTSEHPLSSTSPLTRGGEGKLGPRRPPSYQELTLQAHQHSSGLAVQPFGNRNAFVIPSRLATFGRRIGQKLPPAVQQKMESFFRADFSDVQVHSGPEASSIGALAFTQGSNIYFAPGHYNPNSHFGQQLLAHELTHVVQQRAGRVRNPFGSGVAVVQDPMLEAEAERMGSRAAMYALGAVSPQPVISAVHAKLHGACSCGCGGGCKTQLKEATTLLRRLADHGTVQPATLIGGRRKNPPREATPSRLKKLTRRQQSSYFPISGGITKKKRKKQVCGALDQPGRPNWRGTLWDGNQRPAWSLAAQGIIAAGVTMCAWPGAVACPNFATDRDHIVPYRIYISNNANLRTFCDRRCHFLGISWADASAWSNHLPNLRPLCAAHNGLKAAADRANPHNVNQPPTVIGACPNAPLGCQLGGCAAQVCL